jgi:hypothetical protein
MAEPITGRDVDERAKAILATRLAATGQPADSYLLDRVRLVV